MVPLSAVGVSYHLVLQCLSIDAETKLCVPELAIEFCFHTIALNDFSFCWFSSAVVSKGEQVLHKGCSSSDDLSCIGNNNH